MPKNKERRELEFHKSKIRELQKQVRQLQKQLAYYDKRSHILDLVDLIEDDKDVFPIKKPKLMLCSHCNVGEMLPKFEFDIKTIYECTNCSKRKSVKKV